MLVPFSSLAHPSRGLLERIVKAIINFPPLAFPSGAYVEARVFTLVGPMLIGSRLGVRRK
jgi:hypothetical protein